MRKLMLAALLLLTIGAFAQPAFYQADRITGLNKVEAKQYFYLRGYRIDSISNDTNFTSNSVNIVPTQFAVKRLLANNAYSSVLWANVTGKVTANGTTDGILSYADWLAFNGKQAALNSTSGLAFVKFNGATASYDLNTYVKSTGDTISTLLFPTQTSLPAAPTAGFKQYAYSGRLNVVNSLNRRYGISAYKIPNDSAVIDTLPSISCTLVGTLTADTLKNKTIDGLQNNIKNVSLTTGVTGLLPDANVASAASWNLKTALNGTGIVRMTGITPSYLTTLDSTVVTQAHSENYFNTKYLMLTNGDTIRSNVTVKVPNATPTSFNGNLRLLSSDAAANGKGATIALGGNASTANMNFAAITGRREDGSSDRGFFAIFTNGTGQDGTQWVERFRVGSDGDCSINSVKNNANYVVPFTIYGSIGQSANLLNFKNNSGTVLTSIGSAGELVINGATLTDKFNIIGNINLQNAGNKIKQATGTNAATGNVTLTGGVATVSTTAVTANSQIFLTVQETGTYNGRIRVSAKVTSTSFSVSTGDAGDNCVVTWEVRN